MKNINQTGFTILEVLIAGFMLVVLGMGILGLQYIIGESQLSSIDSFTEVNESTAAVSTITREIRTAQKGEDGSFQFTLAMPNEIIFYSDLNVDGKIEQIRYYKEGTSLKKDVIKPTGNPVTYPVNQKITTVISENIRNGTTPIFSYFNKDWPHDTSNNPLPTPADLDNIKMVHIYVRVNPKANDYDNDYILESQAQVRTLKQNF